jgi:glycosyltransferase involved in cell wall biosynthesis
MKICFFGLENLPVLAPEFNRHGVGGEQVQHTLLAKALARREHSVSMVVYDYGQPDCAAWHGVTTYKAYRQHAGIPMLRFVHPRWTAVWAALHRANADIYYVSCAGMHLGLLVLFCKRHGGKVVFRVAHDDDCDPAKLLIKYWRDKKLYEYGLRHADCILVQSARQQAAMLTNYGLQSHIAGMLVDIPERQSNRDIDVLWVNNIRQFKRPDLLLALANQMPNVQFHMVGGDQPGFAQLYDHIRDQAATLPNLTFHGHIPYHEMDCIYARAKIFVNTSDSEGFPNSYLQAWVRGTPVVAFFDPDNIIQQERLGLVPTSVEEMREAIATLLSTPVLWSKISTSCKSYMERAYGENSVLFPYLNTFQMVA